MFDVLIALGRLSFGGAPAGQYAMPQTLLLAGLVIFAISRLPSGGGARALSGFALFGYSAMVILVLAQTVIATDFGLRQGNAIKQSAIQQARLDANFAQVPAAERECYESHVLAGGLLINHFGLAELGLERSDLLHDQWSVFQPASYRRFQAEGLPRVPLCDGHPASH